MGNMILSLEDIVDEVTVKHYNHLIEDNNILVLTDNSGKDKLLGMTKDILYFYGQDDLINIVFTIVSVSSYKILANY